MDSMITNAILPIATDDGPFQRLSDHSRIVAGRDAESFGFCDIADCGGGVGGRAYKR
jgi:hypothetical protein